uniref:Uncharacterized protein n=1 Tax=Rhizophora mucronata TaxID=61149 RepID=A0A2P2PV30_RHIMU
MRSTVLMREWFEGWIL